MDWLDQASSALQIPHQTNTQSLRQLDELLCQNPQAIYRNLNEKLKFQSFIIGDKLTYFDLYTANALMQITDFLKLLKGKQKPFHVCRWFTHIFSLFPNKSHKFWKWIHGSRDQRIIIAVKNDNIEQVKNLLQEVDVDNKEARKRWKRAIHFAAIQCNKEMFDLLLQAGASIESKCYDGLTPIFYAVQKGNLDFVKFLISRGANPHEVEDEQRNLFYWACNGLQLEIAEYLREIGVDPNAQTRLGRNALSKGAWNGSLEVVKMILEGKGFDINQQDNRGRTALHNAVWGQSGGRSGQKMSLSGYDSPECTELLIQHGIDIEKSDHMGNTALCIAASTDAINSLRLLLKYNASLNHVNLEGGNPISEAVKHGSLGCTQELVQYAQKIGFDIDFEYLIDTAILANQIAILDYLIKISNFTRSNLHTCIKNNHIEILKQYDTQLKEFYNQQALKFALEQGDFEIVDFLAVRCESNDECILLGLERKYPNLDLLLDKSETEFSSQIVIKSLECGIGCINFVQRGQINEECLLAAIQYNREEAAIEIIQLQPQLVYERYEHNRTTLHLAAMHGMSGLAILLCQQSQLINEIDDQELTAISLAQIYNKKDIVTLLQSMEALQKEFKVLKLSYRDSDVTIPNYPFDLDNYHHTYPKPYNQISINSPIVWVDTIQGLEDCWNVIKDLPMVGLDLEYFGFEKNKGCIALIQLSTNDTDFVIDGFYNRDQLRTFMVNLMGSYTITKIMHGCDTDIKWLVRDFQSHAINIFDTAKAYIVLTNTKMMPSLAKLVQIVIGIQLDKTFQVANWSIRPLPPPMLDYARDDSRYLCSIYKYFHDNLNQEQLRLISQNCNNLKTLDKVKKNSIIVEVID